MSEIPQAATEAATQALNALEDAASRGYQTPDAIVRLVLEAAAPHFDHQADLVVIDATKQATAAERERIAALAEQYGAAYPVTRQDTYGQEYEAGESFADLIREEGGAA